MTPLAEPTPGGQTDPGGRLAHGRAGEGGGLDGCWVGDAAVGRGQMAGLVEDRLQPFMRLSEVPWYAIPLPDAASQVVGRPGRVRRVLQLVVATQDCRRLMGQVVVAGDVGHVGSPGAEARAETEDEIGTEVGAEAEVEVRAETEVRAEVGTKVGVGAGI